MVGIAHCTITVLGLGTDSLPPKQQQFTQHYTYTRRQKKPGGLGFGLKMSESARISSQLGGSMVTTVTLCACLCRKKPDTFSLHI